MRCSRRTFLDGVLVCVTTFLLFTAAALAQSDPLPSWNDGSAKQAIVNFVKMTTDKSSPRFVPQEERIATFVRVYSEEMYGIPPEQVVGSAGGTSYSYDKNGRPFLTKETTPASQRVST
jgi:hypothetical protein